MLQPTLLQVAFLSTQKRHHYDCNSSPCHCNSGHYHSNAGNAQGAVPCNVVLPLHIGIFSALRRHSNSSHHYLCCCCCHCRRPGWLLPFTLLTLAISHALIVCCKSIWQTLEKAFFLNSCVSIILQLVTQHISLSFLSFHSEKWYTIVLYMTQALFPAAWKSTLLCVNHFSQVDGIVSNIFGGVRYRKGTATFAPLAEHGLLCSKKVFLWVSGYCCFNLVCKSKFLCNGTAVTPWNSLSSVDSNGNNGRKI